MARWIDADLIENIDLIPYKRGSENINAIIANVAIVGAKQVVDKIPTADVAPVIHAHWETDNYGYAILNEEGHTMYLAGVPCSRCHVTGQTNWNYCPRCGAKMDEEVEDG